MKRLDQIEARAMPGPPECECREVPEQFWTTYAGAVDPVTQIEYTPECPLHGEVSSPKRLTDAECAAEYWRAESFAFFYAANEDTGEQWVLSLGEKTTWHRFATHPHALEEA